MKMKGGFMKTFLSAVIFIFMIVFLTTLAQAQQPEPSVACVEGVIAQLNYGEHTTGCDIGSLDLIQTETLILVRLGHALAQR